MMRNPYAFCMAYPQGFCYVVFGMNIDGYNASFFKVLNGQWSNGWVIGWIIMRDA